MAREYKEKYKLSSKERQSLRKAYIEAKKNVPCHDCGKSFPPCCMDLHHIEEKDDLLKGRHKTGNLRNGKSIGSTMKCWSIQKIDEEFRKCVVLCACCHRIRHADDHLKVKEDNPTQVIPTISVMDFLED